MGELMKLQQTHNETLEAMQTWEKKRDFEARDMQYGFESQVAVYRDKITALEARNTRCEPVGPGPFVSGRERGPQGQTASGNCAARARSHRSARGDAPGQGK